MNLRLKSGEVVNIRFMYFRKPNQQQQTVVSVRMQGGLQSGDKEYSSSAWCSPADRFNKAFGRKIALRRAIQFLPRELRTQIWKAYFDFIGAKHACRECGMVGNHKMSCDTR